MPTYAPPVEDIRFVLHEVVDIESLQTLPGYAEVSRDLVDAILYEAGRFCADVLFPLNRSGDEEGCHYENGVVRTPAGFKDAYRRFVEAGWMGLYCDPRYGGQGLPALLNTMVDEMLCGSNLSFSMYVALTHGVYNALALHGADELRARFLPNLVSGRWTGTMCLTEPHCGTDLGLIRTRAVPVSGGSYRISGTKIFISAGEHDLSENIVHLVLARVPDAPPGTRGISLFLVPKLAVGADGSVGASNGVACGGIEHKMGINASATCVLNFDEAEGFLVGGLNRGLAAMFTMMNAARIEVGIQGIGLAETAYQGAVAYARERLQGRALRGARHPDKAADPILVHPDVRRMLLTMRAYTEGARAVAAWVAKRVDLAAKDRDAEARAEAEDLIALMTPIVKALFTDIGVEVANLGVQVYGGHGYIRDNGMEQYVRDARITQIYEGTNGVQALDLVGRKLPQSTGRLLRRFFHPVHAHIVAAQASDRETAELIEPLAKGFGRLQRATAWIAEKGLLNPDDAGAAASDYLRLFGLVAMGYLWTRMADAARQRLAQPAEAVATATFYRAKIETASFFMQRLMPQTGALFASIVSGSRTLMAFDDEAF
jgi:butyryl-CoA dehydrogenase